jgi:hypothetical protein
VVGACVVGAGVIGAGVLIGAEVVGDGTTPFLPEPPSSSSPILLERPLFFLKPLNDRWSAVVRVYRKG